MSETFNAAAQALANDPELRDKVLAAGSSEERQAILREAGVSVPEATDVTAGFHNLAGVAGGGKTTNTIAAAAPAAAAACGGC